MAFDGTPHLIKPEGAWELERGCPLARGLAFFLPCTEGGGDPIDLVTGDAWTLAASVAWVRDRHGLTLDGVTGGIAQGPNDAIVTSNDAGTGDFSVAVLANPTAAATVKTLYSQRAAGVAIGGLAANCSNFAQPTAQSGTVTFATWANSTLMDVVVTSRVDGGYHLWCGVRAGTTLTLDEDGAEIGTDSGTVRDIAAGSESWFGARNAANGLTERGVFCVAWNRALTAKERRDLPWAIWQLLVPLPDFGVVGFKAAGGTTFNQALTVSGAGTASLTAIKVILATLTATAMAAATLVKRFGKVLAGSGAGSAAVANKFALTRAATASATGTLTKRIAKTLGAATANVVALVAQFISGALRPAKVTVSDAAVTTVAVNDAAVVAVAASDAAVITVTLADSAAA